MHRQSSDLAELTEALAPQASKGVAVVIGRFNPPTIGHYAIINAAKKFIRSHPALALDAAPVVVIIDGKGDLAKNPLSARQREQFMAASGHADGVKFLTAPNAFAAFAQLREQRMEPIAVAAGSDRIADYMRMLDNYFMTDDSQPIQHYEISAPRTQDQDLSTLSAQGSPDIRAVSATLARRAVELDWFDEFVQLTGLTNKRALARRMFDAIKKASGQE